MNHRKFALLYALLLGAGLVAVPAASYAADAPVKKPAAAKPAQPEPGYRQKCCDDEPCAGHGMMDGHDGGMMGGMMDGHDHGMMLESPRMHMVMSLKLSDDQRAKINKLNDELRHKNWALMGQIMDESAKLRDLYEADKRDPKVIGAEYQKIFDIKRQMIEAMLDTQNHVEELLTPEQLAQLKEMRSQRGMMSGHHMMH